MCIEKLIRSKRVVIVAHVFVTGPAQELEEYLKIRVNFLVFIGHPLFYNTDANSFCRIYKKGALIKDKILKWKLPEPFNYLKDIFYTFLWVIKVPQRFELYIGVNCLNALIGIILKKLRRVKKVIFYAIDYVPNRFNNKFLNWVYHKVDTFCAKSCDYVWNLSKRMIEARRRKGVKKINNQLIVPIGVHSERIKVLPINRINRKTIVYMGHLREKQGLELVIESFPEIVKKVPDIKFIIIGKGRLEKYLKNRTQELKLENYVELMGYIEDHKKVEEILKTCAVGLALYEPGPDSFTWYTDPSKPKQYMVCGLPVIITRVPEIAKVIDERKLGIVVDYRKEDFVAAVIRLLKDESYYKKCRENAIEFISNISWNAIFKVVLRKSLISEKLH